MCLGSIPIPRRSILTGHQCLCAYWRTENLSDMNMRLRRNESLSYGDIGKEGRDEFGAECCVQMQDRPFGAPAISQFGTPVEAQAADCPVLCLSGRNPEDNLHD